MLPITASGQQRPAETPHETMLQMIQGFAVTQAIYVATKLGIADLLKDGPQPAAVLAAQTSTDADALSRLLRALASIGVFVETMPDVFDMTPLATCMQADAPQSLYHFILFRAEQDYVYWQHALHTMRTGASAFEYTFGMERFAYFDQHPENKAHFVKGLVEANALNNTALAAAYDFAALHTVQDIGGGNGKRLATILAAYPTLHGVLVEQTATLALARPVLESAGVLDRCALVEGDWFTAVPAGADAYMLSVLHRWDDETCLKVLANCRTAMHPDARLLIVERVITPTTPWRIHFANVNMLLSSSGQIRTDAEFRRLLTTAGFVLNHIIPTDSVISILEATLAEAGESSRRTVPC